jgi:hypothetical protein
VYPYLLCKKFKYIEENSYEILKGNIKHLIMFFFSFNEFYLMV